MSAAWPWPQDTRIDKLKRIVDSYRTALMEVASEACHVVDGRMCEFGESWVCDDAVVNVEEWSTVADIYAQFGPGFEPWNVHLWASRHPDEVPLRGKRSGRNLYRVGDVLAYQVSLRR